MPAPRRQPRPRPTRTSAGSTPAGSTATPRAQPGAAPHVPTVPNRAGAPRGGRGLYGSSVGNPNQLRTGLAELLGTYLLVLVGTATAATTVLNDDLWDAGVVALAFGLTLAALAAGLGHVSGCHVNPAVTVGLAAAGRFPWRYVPAYVGAQLLGAVLASLTLWAGYGDQARDRAGLGAATPGDEVGVGSAFLIETVITFLLVFVVCAVATDDRAPSAIAPVAVGFALAGAIYVGLPVTGGAVNPARAFGPFLVGLQFPMWPVYLFAPLLGGVLGALVYDKVIRQADAPST